MSRQVFAEFTRFTFLAPGDPIVEGELLSLDDALRARSFLERFLTDPSDMPALRDFHAERVGPGLLDYMSDHEVVDAIARSIEAGEVRVIREPEFLPGGEAEHLPEEPEPVAPAVTETGHWIKFRVVDDETEEPVAGVTLSIREPSGAVRDYETRPDGMIEIDEIDAGTCDIVSMNDDEAIEVVRVE
jgi:hypothetical protein